MTNHKPEYEITFNVQTEEGNFLSTIRTFDLIDAIREELAYRATRGEHIISFTERQIAYGEERETNGEVIAAR